MEVDLRLILLGIGAVVIAGILLDSFRRRRQIQRQMQEFEETVLSNPEGGSNLFVDESASLEQISTPRPIESKTQTLSHDPEIIALTLTPLEAASFSGRALNAAVQANQLKFGHKRIYHKHRGDQVEAQQLFSLASLTEPGYFDPTRLATQQFKGLILFMDAANLHDPLPTFEKMVATARNMAHSMNAQLCDESRNHLSAQIVEHMKEKIREIQRRQLAQEKSLEP